MLGMNPDAVKISLLWIAIIAVVFRGILYFAIRGSITSPKSINAKDKMPKGVPVELPEVTDFEMPALTATGSKSIFFLKK